MAVAHQLVRRPLSAEGLAEPLADQAIEAFSQALTPVGLKAFEYEIRKAQGSGSGRLVKVARVITAWAMTVVVESDPKFKRRLAAARRRHRPGIPVEAVRKKLSK